MSSQTNPDYLIVRKSIDSIYYDRMEELDGSAVSELDIRLRKLSNIGRSLDGWPIYYLELLRASEAR
jgi:hypothetical protein